MNSKRESIESLILDMDGVLWRGNQQIGNLIEVFETIFSLGLSFVFATNNSTLSVEQYVKKLEQFGVHINPEQIINSSLATVYYLLQKFPGGGSIFCIGEEGLKRTLSDFGYEHSNHEPLAVVVGLDRNLTYQILADATLHIRSGVPFIATNPDKTLPTPRGMEPGAGSIIEALVAATDIEPQIIGKPDIGLYELALERLSNIPANTLVIGDRLETDIAGAQKLGCRTALVLSGVTNRILAEKWHPPIDFIAPDLTSLLHQLESI